MFLLSEEQRKELINSLSYDYPKLEFGTFELGGINSATDKTLRSIMKKYDKDTKFYYLIGADKLHSIPNWNNIENILSNMSLIVYEREDIDINKIINESEILTKYKDSIIILKSNDDTNGISSSRVRELFATGKDYSFLMDKRPYQILSKLTMADFKELTDDELIEYTLKYFGRFNGNAARKLVYLNNVNIFKNWDENVLGNREDKLKGTKVYSKEFFVKCSNNYETKFTVANIDISYKAKELIDKGLNPVIINSCSLTNPCKEYDKGKDGVEETLCQMSTLSQNFFQFGNPKFKRVREANVSLIPDVYPLDSNFGGIYSKDVCFFRYNIDRSYSQRKDTFDCSVISVPNLDVEDSDYVVDKKYLSDMGKIIEKNKLRTMFRIALDNNHDSIVLDNLGVKESELMYDITSLIKEVLNEEEFKNKFREIGFAINEGKGSARKIVGKDGKFKPFYDCFNNN